MWEHTNQHAPERTVAVALLAEYLTTDGDRAVLQIGRDGTAQMATGASRPPVSGERIRFGMRCQARQWSPRRGERASWRTWAFVHGLPFGAGLDTPQHAPIHGEANRFEEGRPQPKACSYLRRVRYAKA